RTAGKRLVSEKNQSRREQAGAAEQGRGEDFDAFADGKVGGSPRNVNQGERNDDLPSGRRCGGGRMCDYVHPWLFSGGSSWSNRSGLFLLDRTGNVVSRFDVVARGSFVDCR